MTTVATQNGTKPASSSPGSLASALFNRKKPTKAKKKQTPPPSRPNGVVSPSPPPVAAQDPALSSADDGQVDDLADQLLSQLDARDKASSRQLESVPTSSASIVSQQSESSVKSSSSSRSLKEGMKDLFSPARAKSRQQARREKRDQEIVQMQLQARKELMDNKETDWAQEEHSEMMRICGNLHAELREIPPDGHCLYAALADQINSHRFNRELETYQTVRTNVAAHMRENPDDYLPFLLSETGDDDDGLMSPEAYATYCDKVEKTTEWGGQPEIIAASKAFKVPVHVYQAHTKTVKIGDEEFSKGMPLRLSYHRYMYGLGEHYNSLRQKIDYGSHFIAPTF